MIVGDFKKEKLTLKVLQRSLLSKVQLVLNRNFQIRYYASLGKIFTYENKCKYLARTVEMSLDFQIRTPEVL